MRTLFIVIFLTTQCIIAYAQLQVMMSGGFSNPYKELIPGFERSTGVHVSTTSGASQGVGSQTIKAKLEQGATPDVVILSREGLSELMQLGKILPNSDKDLGSAPLAIAVPQGSFVPDIHTVELFKQALIRSKKIVVPGSTSGIFLINKVFPELGVTDLIQVQVTERGAQTVTLLAAKEAQMAILPTSEIKFAPGVQLVGLVPEQLQLLQVFSIAILKESEQKQNAKMLIEYLTSKGAEDAILSREMQLS